MLDSLVHNILEVGLYIYLVPIFLGFFIFSESLYLFYEEQEKFISWIGLIFLLSFVLLEYFSKTNIHLITDTLMSLKTGYLKFSNINFLTILLITFFVAGIFRRYTLISLIIGFIFFWGFPKEALDIGFLTFVLGAGYQVYQLTNEKDYFTSYNYDSLNSSSISFESFTSIIITILTLVIKILKVF